MSRSQRIELLLFIACFLSFSYFYQGGGWNQNARFAEVRAMVEEGRAAIDDFIVYERVPGSDILRRDPLDHAEYSRNGKRFRLSWVDMAWNLFPVNESAPAPGVENAAMVEVCASGDIGYVPETGHFHPNKPPGTSFLAVPGYFVLFHVEKWLGINPDHWWVLTLNAWLTTVCSVGLAAALACVMFFRLASQFSEKGPMPALLATLSFAFGTTFLPFATLFFDHALTAALLVGAFYFLCCRKTPGAAAMAGVCAGFAAVTNYVAAIAVIFLGFYALLGTQRGGRNWRIALFYSLGVVGPFVLICAYAMACFGSPFKINNDYQNPLFKETGGALFGMFAIPRSLDALFRLAYITGLLLFSPFRGMLYLAPVLAMGFYGAWVWLKEKTFVAEARLCLAIFGFFFFINMTFNGYHGGFSAGPRYLVPGLPFLALPLVVAFSRWGKLTSLLAAISVFIQVLLTVTDAQNPVGVGGHARIEGRRTEWQYDILGDYAWPLFFHGRAWPLLEDQMGVHMEKETARISAQFHDAAAQKAALDEVRSGLRESIVRGESSPFLLGAITGPVSVNPLGMFEGLLTFEFYAPGTAQCRWASFNLGEFWMPESRWSLVPLGLIDGMLFMAMLALARRSTAEGCGMAAEGLMTQEKGQGINASR